MSQNEISGPPGLRRCVCPGSYDPITEGHLDVVMRATRLFDEVVVAVLDNPAKRGTFAVSDRVALVNDAIAQRLGSGREQGGAGTVSVRTFTARLLVDVCREVGAVAVVKGLRGPADFGYEQPMAAMNRHLTGVETVFLAGDPALSHISSSLVKEVAALGGDVTGMVTEQVRDRLVDLRNARTSEEG